MMIFMPPQAPDITASLLDGYQPADLELERLLRGVPLAWVDQRRMLEFSTGA